MKALPLAIITTRLPPAQTCGIGDYSRALQAHWPNEQSEAKFLAMEGSGPGVTAFQGNAGELARALDRIGPARVLLHYAGRAYQRFGCPFWMPRVLAHWKREFPGARLAIFFHETPGRFPMRSRQFWLAQAGARIARQLAAIADVLITNTADQVAQLQKISGRGEVHLLPVGSNITTAPASSERRAKTEFVIFGLPFGRWQTLEIFQSHLRRWQVDGRLTRLHLVGPQDEEFSRRADGLVPDELLVRHGLLPSAQVAELLRRVGFALTNVSEKTWSKSGAFMACTANQCPVVISSNSQTIPLSYAVGVEEIGTISTAELARRSEALARWYEANADWPVVARRIADLLG